MAVAEAVEDDAEAEDDHRPGQEDQAQGDQDELPVPSVVLRDAVAKQDKDENLAGHAH